MSKSRSPASATRPLAFSLHFDRSQKRALDKYLLSLCIALLVVAAFLLFKNFIHEKSDPYALEITAAIMGTALTAALLRHQTHSHIDRERNVKIYETKLEIYQNLLQKIEGILEDERISQNEFFRLQLAFQEVVFIAGPRVLNELPAFAYVVASVEHDSRLPQDAKKRILHAFGRLAAEVRADLHDPHPHGEDIAFDVEDVLTKIEANFDRHNSLSESVKKEAVRRQQEAGNRTSGAASEHLGLPETVQAFLERCNVEEARTYSAVFKSLPEAIKPCVECGCLVLRTESRSDSKEGRSGRIILHIHPDIAVPNKIFPDNLSLNQRIAVRITLRGETWKHNVISHWTFTTQGVGGHALLNLIETMASLPITPDSSASNLQRTAH